MNTLCLFGGGRWARVLLSVLINEFPNIKCIIWVTKNNYQKNVLWLNEQKIQHIKIVREDCEAWAFNPQAIIVATSSHIHAKYVKEALIRKIPVLSEKPLCFSLTDAKQLALLSTQLKVPVGVNYEFRYGCYLDCFATFLKKITIRSIDISWEDPFYEERYGELKFSDIYTPILFDSFQHCLSILNFLLSLNKLSIETVTYSKNSRVCIKLNTLSEDISININLSRRAEKRIRVMSINNGKAILDFSIEPGFISLGKKIIQNKWSNIRPLAAVFNSFFEVIKDQKLLSEWFLSICNCLDVISLSEKANYLLEEIQKNYLYQRMPLSEQDEFTRNLLIDLYLPKLIAQGEYHRAHTLEEQSNFSKYIIELIKSRP